MSSASGTHLSHYPAGPNGFFRAPVVLSDSSSAILVDGGFTFSDGESVAKAIQQSGKKLTTVYISQSDPDFYFSLKPIHQHFPEVPVLSKPSTLSAIQGNVQKKLAVWGPKLKENGPQALSDIILPTASDAQHLKLGSESIDVVETALPNRYYLWSSSLHAIFGGVLVFADVHVWVADLPSAEQRAKWIQILDEMLARQPKTVIAGHLQPTSATDVSAIAYTRQYLLALEEERAKAANSGALIEAMKKRYPNAGMEVALDIGAKVLMGEMQWDTSAKPVASTPLQLIKSTYEGKSSENATRLPALLDAEVEWTEAEGFPYAGTYRGPQAVVENVFKRLGSEWENYAAHAEQYVTEGDIVVVFGHYTGTYKATGKSIRADFVHRYEISNAKIKKMKQYVDSALVRAAMQP